MTTPSARSGSAELAQHNREPDTAIRCFVGDAAGITFPLHSGKGIR
jgi:hypothetical protein